MEEVVDGVGRNTGKMVEGTVDVGFGSCPLLVREAGLIETDESIAEFVSAVFSGDSAAAELLVCAAIVVAEDTDDEPLLLTLMDPTEGKLLVEVLAGPTVTFDADDTVVAEGAVAVLDVGDSLDREKYENSDLIWLG